jgi:hypothetical protein
MTIRFTIGVGIRFLRGVKEKEEASGTGEDARTGKRRGKWKKSNLLGNLKKN